MAGHTFEGHLNVMNEYKIVKATTTEDLESEVAHAIRDGWQPIGGLCTAIIKTVAERLSFSGTPAVEYYQALVR
jgi:hypothetical protein